MVPGHTFSCGPWTTCTCWWHTCTPQHDKCTFHQDHDISHALPCHTQTWIPYCTLVVDTCMHQACGWGTLSSGAGVGGGCAALLGALSAGILMTSFFASAITVFLAQSCLLPGYSSGSNSGESEHCRTSERSCAWTGVKGGSNSGDSDLCRTSEWSCAWTGVEGGVELGWDWLWQHRGLH